MKEKFLLGATIDNELVFGEFRITKRNGYPEFTSTFDVVHPFNGENYDLKSYYENWIEDIDKPHKLDLLEEYDCKPSELVEKLVERNDDIRDVLDCSLYPEEIIVDGESWYFESCSCGQHDTRDDMEEIINPEAYNLIHELWDKYHLKK